MRRTGMVGLKCQNKSTIFFRCVTRHDPALQGNVIFQPLCCSSNSPATITMSLSTVVLSRSSHDRALEQ
jgi:hypothetical protein